MKAAVLQAGRASLQAGRASLLFLFLANQALTVCPFLVNYSPTALGFVLSCFWSEGFFCLSHGLFFVN